MHIHKSSERGVSISDAVGAHYHIRASQIQGQRDQQHYERQYKKADDGNAAQMSARPRADYTRYCPEFWTEKANMPNSTIDRMMLVLEKMYSPQTEAEYLNYSSKITKTIRNIICC